MFITVYFCHKNVEKPILCSLFSTLKNRPHHLVISVHFLDWFLFFFMTYPCGYMWSTGLQCLLNENFIQKYIKYTVIWLMLDELLSMPSPLYWQWTHFLWTRYWCISFPFNLSHLQCFNWICRDNGWNSLVTSDVCSIGRTSVTFEISNRFKAEYLNMVAVFFLWSFFPQRNKALEMTLWTLYVTCLYLGLLQQMALLPLRSFVCIECITHH